MILITGATGNLGKATIEFLSKKIPSENIAVLVRDENKASDLKALGVDVRTGDYHEKDSLVKAFRGVEKLLLISSNDFNDRLGQQKNAVDAAKEAGVKHILYTGVSMQNFEHSALKQIMGDHFDTEKHILESGLTYTFLRDNLYADVLPMFIGEHVFETGIHFPAGEGKVPFSLRIEMAEAFANVLSSEGHENKIYEISNSESYSFQDVANALSAHTGKPVAYHAVSADDFRKTLSEAGVPEAMIGFSLAFATGAKDGDFDIPNNHLEQLLGRKPSSLDEAIREIYQ